MANGRRRIRIGLLLAIVLACSAALWFVWPNERAATRKIYEQIGVGMPLERVAEMFGRDGTILDEPPVMPNDGDPFGGGVDPAADSRHISETVCWFQESAIIVVYFDSDGRAVDKEILNVHGPTGFQIIRRFLERFGW